MIYLPMQVVPAFETIRKKLNLPALEIEKLLDFSFQAETVKRYDLKAWRQIFSDLYPEYSQKGLLGAYYQACIGARYLDRWKRKLETFPAWVRRLPEVRHINEHTQQMMSEACKSRHRQEIIGLALARMETLERKTKKCKRLQFAVAGEARLLGNKAWCTEFEKLLPKGMLYHYSYSYFSLLRGSDLYKQLLWEMVDFKPVLYDYRDNIWSVRNFSGFDGVIWVGAEEKMPQNLKRPVIFCSKNADKADKERIMTEYKKLKGE